MKAIWASGWRTSWNRRHSRTIKPVKRNIVLSAKPLRGVAFRVLLLLTYSLLFSVQVCFRYTGESLDLDAYRSTFVTASSHAAPTSITFHKGDKTESPHILNKRFEPVNALYIPTREFGLPVSYSLLRNTYYTKADHLTGRFPATVSLRGPPAPVC